MAVLRNKWVLALIRMVAIALVLFVGLNMLGQGARAANVQTLPVQRGDIESTLLSSDALQPVADLNLSCQDRGQVPRIQTHAGDRVKQGDKLAALDSRYLQLAVDQAAASLQSAQAKLDQVQAGATQK